MHLQTSDQGELKLGFGDYTCNWGTHIAAFYETTTEWYETTMDFLHEEYYAESRKNGKRNIRATAEMVWALQAIIGVEHLMAYESRLTYFFPGKPWLSICLYNITKFPGNIIINVLRTHSYTLSGGVLISNPYFTDPDEYLRKYYPEFSAKQYNHESGL
jgi:hypothetical protein